MEYRKLGIWRLTLLVGLVGGIGGIIPDIGYLISEEVASILHSPLIAVIVSGVAIALLGGLILTLVLGGNKKWKRVKRKD